MQESFYREVIIKDKNEFKYSRKYIIWVGFILDQNKQKNIYL